jgi:predicted lipoprotein with Yx(FWY)xxD motif
MFNGFKLHSLRRYSVVASMLVAAMVLAACQSAGAQTIQATQPPATQAPVVTQAPAMTEAPATPTELAPTATQEALVPSVTVESQPIDNGEVTVADVVSNGPGWIVIHAQADGKPGPILGFSPVKDGDNKDVVVKIDATKATPTLYAMLHIDAGTVGTFEFPNGPDTPVKVDGQVVTPSFQVTGGLPAATPIVLLGGNDKLGQFLTDANGMTLYMFTKDNAGDSTCYDSCATNWPPLTVQSAQNLVAGNGVTGTLATVTRTDGSLQVTYNGWPLYYFAKDSAPGDTNGQGLLNAWFVAPLSGDPQAPAAQISNNNQTKNYPADVKSGGMGY